MRRTTRNGLVIATLVATGCSAPPFSFDPHSGPRVFVRHEPIAPNPGEALAFIAEAEAAPGHSVTKIEIHAHVSGVDNLVQVCDAVATCTLSVPAGAPAGTGFYSARVTQSDGETAGSASAYLYQVGAGPAAADRVLRLPFDLKRNVIGRSYRTLLVRHQDSYSSSAALRADLTTMIYERLLKDPAYRWRDNQLGFMLFPGAGRNSDYYSGLQTRCGQRPFAGMPNEALLKERIDTAFDGGGYDLVGVIHNTSGWRDCAGLGSGGGDRRNFSSFGKDPYVFAHEFSHALAGLGDEYLESTSSRTAPGGPPANAIACTCCDPTGGTTDPGGGVVVPTPGVVTGADELVDVDVGGIIGGNCQPGQPLCTQTLPESCFPAEPACPPLQSTCVSPNLFESSAECAAIAVAAAAHAGVEKSAEAIASNCRLLCTGAECPCAASHANLEVWYLDKRTPPADVATQENDAMGTLDGLTPDEELGPACELCLENIFCRRWEEGRRGGSSSIGGACTFD